MTKTKIGKTQRKKLCCMIWSFHFVVWSGAFTLLYDLELSLCCIIWSFHFVVWSGAFTLLYNLELSLCCIIWSFHFVVWSGAFTLLYDLELSLCCMIWSFHFVFCWVQSTQIADYLGTTCGPPDVRGTPVEEHCSEANMFTCTPWKVHFRHTSILVCTILLKTLKTVTSGHPRVTHRTFKSLCHICVVPVCAHRQTLYLCYKNWILASFCSCNIENLALKYWEYIANLVW
jgi:hypothetical protein